MRLPPEIFRDWSGGVITSLRGDELPENASPHGLNAALSNISGGKSSVIKRKGATRINTTSLGSSIILRAITQWSYRDPSTGAITKFTLALASDNKLYWLKDDGSTAEAASGVTTAATQPFFESAANTLFLMNGTDKKKVLNISATLTVQAWGMTRPPAPTSALDGAGSMSGDYEFAITYHNHNATSESSLSDAAASLTCTNNAVQVTWSESGLDTQITHIRVHVRKSTMTQFLYTGTEVAVGTGHAHINLTSTQLQALSILSPTVTANDPPPTGIKGAAWHLGRMFVFDDNNIYWSKQSYPEQFDPEDFEPIGTGDGQKIIAIKQIHDSTLLILKANSFYVLEGTNSDNWTFRCVDPVVGCAAPGSVVTFDHKVAWWSHNGPTVWAPEIAPTFIGINLLSTTLDETKVEHTRLNQIVGCVDSSRRRILWSYPGNGDTNNTHLLPFNYHLGVFDSEDWNPFDVSCMCEAEDTNIDRWIYMGGYYGRAFKFWSGDVDGVPNDKTLQGTCTGGTATYFDDSTADFSTDLIGNYAYVISANGYTTQRRRITASTTTRITVTPDFDAIPNSQFTYVIGSPQFVWDTRWTDAGLPFNKKRFLTIYAQALTNSADTTLKLLFFIDQDSEVAARTFNMPVGGTGGVFDVDKWDESYYGIAGTAVHKERIAKTGFTYRIRAIHTDANKQMLLIKLSVLPNLLSDKR